MRNVLWEYTIDQVNLFYEAGQENVQQEFLNNTFAVRVGMNADAKQWKDFISSFKVMKQKPKAFTKTDALELMRLSKSKKNKKR